jgi:hypothetical protein
MQKINHHHRKKGNTDGTNYIPPLPLELHASQSSGYKIGEPISFQWRATTGTFNLTTAQLKGAKVYFQENPALVLPADAAVRLTSCFLEYKTATSSPTTLVSSTLSIDLKPLASVNAIDFESIPAAGGGSTPPPPMPLPRLVDALVEHFNLNLEYYHRVIWLAMDAQTRFNILEGMVYDCIPEMDTTATPPVPKKDPIGTYVLIKSYRTVAQVTENALVGIVGNSWVLPAAKGTTLDPTIRVQEGETLFSTIKEDVDVIKTRISLPTPGIYAETYLSECNACERIDEDSSQDWSIFKTDEPTAINPLDTGSRYQNPGNLQPKDMQQPIINIQNAPAAPDPTGLSAALGLLGTQGLFKDMTGLEGTQNIALQGMLGNQQAALGYASMATKMAALGQTEKLMKLVNGSKLPDVDKTKLLQTILGKAATFLGMGDEGKSGDNGFNFGDIAKLGPGGKASYYPNNQVKEVQNGTGAATKNKFGDVQNADGTVSIRKKVFNGSLASSEEDNPQLLNYDLNPDYELVESDGAYATHQYVGTGTNDGVKFTYVFCTCC